MTENLTPAESEVVDCYQRLERVLREDAAGLPPFAERNAIKALGALWQVVNGLDQEPGHPYEIGV